MRIDELENCTSIDYHSNYYGNCYGEIKFFKHIMMNMHCVASGFIVLGAHLI